MPDQPRAICVNCKHCSESNPAQMWYLFLCNHPGAERTAVIDPVTGRTKYRSMNDLGNQVFTLEKRRYCQEVNIDGNCQLYERK